MKANEFVNEAKVGKLNHAHKASINRSSKFSDSDRGTNHAYNRIGLAVAGSDGKKMEHDIDEESWIGTNNLALPYSKEENAMMNHAYKKLNMDYHITVHNKSSESDDTHKVSPVANLNPKRK
jgi:hypothetical protein